MEEKCQFDRGGVKYSNAGMTCWTNIIIIGNSKYHKFVPPFKIYLILTDNFILKLKNVKKNYILEKNIVQC